MNDIISMLLGKPGELGLLVIAVIVLYRRLGKVEGVIDRKLNNGIGTRLHKIDLRMTKIETKMGISDED